MMRMTSGLEVGALEVVSGPEVLSELEGVPLTAIGRSSINRKWDAP
jgi:hypothetical protein